MLHWDDTEFRAQVARFTAAEGRFLAVLTEYASPKVVFLAQRVKANVPKHTGNLEQHVTATALAESTAVGADLVADTPYAVEAHERPGPLDGSTPEGGRGPKYFTRVLDHYPQIWEEPIGQALGETLGGTSSKAR